MMEADAGNSEVIYGLGSAEDSLYIYVYIFEKKIQLWYYIITPV